MTVFPAHSSDRWKRRQALHSSAQASSSPLRAGRPWPAGPPREVPHQFHSTAATTLSGSCATEQCPNSSSFLSLNMLKGHVIALPLGLAIRCQTYCRQYCQKLCQTCCRQDWAILPAGSAGSMLGVLPFPCLQTTPGLAAGRRRRHGPWRAI